MTFAAPQALPGGCVVARSKFYEQDGVSIFDLQLDPFNPRIRHGVDQHDCIERIADDRDSFLRLMKDIAANGLSPKHILLSKSDDGKLVVRDGNRRVTALKLLNRPDLCLPDEGLRNMVFRMASAATTPLVDKLDCLVCDEEETISDYLRREHTGQNGGIGQVDWSALLIALFNLHAGTVDQHRRAAQMILWMEERGRHVSNDFPITTLTRLLNTETLAILGFGVEGDKLVAVLPETSAFALASRIISDIATNVINVTRSGGTGSVYALDAALEYIRRVRQEVGPAEQPPPPADAQPTGGPSEEPASGASGAPWQGGTTGGSDAGPEGPEPYSGGQPAGGGATDPEDAPKDDTANPAGGKPTSGATVKPSWDRPCLFGRRKNSKADFSFPHNRTKVMNVVSELRQLDPNATPMAVALLFRVLLELSDGAYRAVHQMKQADSLPKSIASSADKMLNDGLLSKAEHQVIETYTRGEQTILHVKTIQKFLHDDTSHPNGQGLNTMWDSIGCFVKACWLGVMRAET
jgi:hypothetical protein